MEALDYILGNFWHFLGFIITLNVVIKGIVALVAVTLNRNVEIE